MLGGLTKVVDLELIDLSNHSEYDTKQFISQQAMHILTQKAKRNISAQQHLCKSNQPRKPRLSGQNSDNRRNFKKASDRNDFELQLPRITIKESNVDDMDEEISLPENEIGTKFEDPLSSWNHNGTVFDQPSRHRIYCKGQTTSSNSSKEAIKYQARLTQPQYRIRQSMKERNTLPSRPATTDWSWVRKKLLSRDSAGRPKTSITFKRFLDDLSPNSEECDSDLDDAYFEVATESRNFRGSWQYKRLCGSNGIATAQTAFVQLGDKKFRYQLNHRLLNAKDAAALTEGLRSSKFIEELDLANNAISEKATKSISQFIRENKYINRLDLGGNYFSSIAGRRITKSLFCSHHHLSMLCLKKNKLGDTDAFLLVEVLRVNQSLKSLDVSHNYIGDNAGQAITSMLVDNKSLTSLNLSWNNLCTRGAAGIARGLFINRSLLALDLSWNGLGDVGAALLGLSMKENSTLRFVSLAVNHICGHGGEQLANGICGGKTAIFRKGRRFEEWEESNCAVEYLNLDRNPLSSTTVQKFLSTLSSKRYLKTLSIREIVLNNDIKKQIKVMKQTAYDEIALYYDGQDPNFQAEKLLRRSIRKLNCALKPFHVNLLQVLNALNSQSLGVNAADLRNVLAEYVSLPELEIEQAVNNLDVNHDGIIQYKDVAVYDQD